MRISTAPFLFFLLLTAEALSQSVDLVSYQELPDPKPADKTSWSAVETGHHFSFTTADVRYRKHLVPDPSQAQASWKANAWKGEKVYTQALLWSISAMPQVKLSWSELRDDKGHTIPESRVSARFIRYVMTDGLNQEGNGCDKRPVGTYDSSLVADPIDIIQVRDVPQQTAQPVWLSVVVPATAVTGRYAGTLTATSPSMPKPIMLSYSIDVQNRVLPAPKDWTFHLDLWQNPYSVARVHGVNVWSKEHMDIMRPYTKMLADAGQKSVTATIINDPWQSQTEDVYGSMVKWTKKKDGTWAYDYTIFDQWVNYMTDLGIDTFINCYSMIP